MPRWPWPPSSSPEYPPSAERSGAPRHSRRHSRPAQAPRIAAACPVDPAQAVAPIALQQLFQSGQKRPELRIRLTMALVLRLSLAGPEVLAHRVPRQPQIPRNRPDALPSRLLPSNPCNRLHSQHPLNAPDVAVGGDVGLIGRWPTFVRRSPPQVADFCTPLHSRSTRLARRGPRQAPRPSRSSHRRDDALGLESSPRRRPRHDRRSPHNQLQHVAATASQHPGRISEAYC